MTVQTQLLVESLNRELSVELPENEPWDSVREKLYQYINRLIDMNFEKLLLILYRIDVHEDKLRKLLYEHPATDAGMVIADLIIERQLQKIRTRQEFPQGVCEISEEERW